MASAAVSSSGAPCPSALPEAFGSYLQVGPDAGMVGRPQRRIVRARPIETDLAGEDFDAFGNPDVIDAAVHARPVRMRDRAVPVGERSEGGGCALGRTKAGGHQAGRGGIEAGVEV